MFSIITIQISLKQFQLLILRPYILSIFPFRFLFNLKREPVEYSSLLTNSSYTSITPAEYTNPKNPMLNQKKINE